MTYEGEAARRRLTLDAVIDFLRSPGRAQLTAFDPISEQIAA